MRPPGGPYYYVIVGLGPYLEYNRQGSLTRVEIIEVYRFIGNVVRRACRASCHRCIVGTAPSSCIRCLR